MSRGLYRYFVMPTLLLTLLAGLLPILPARPAYAAQPRPQLSGPELTYGTPHFLIHYTLSGIDAVPPADQDGDKVPDWVQDVGAAMEKIWSVEIDQLGWPAPLPDHGEGGDTRFDVYLMELFSKGLAGYVSPDGGFVGDNPNTARVEQQAAYGYLVLENDFIDPNPPAGVRVWPPSDWMRITASHEFDHMLQIAINGAHPMSFWYEATSNWMETQVFPDLPGNMDSANAVFKSPDTCMLRYGGVSRVESSLHWYGMWTFAQMLSEKYGPGLILDIWLRMADGPGYVPFDDAFAARGTTFEAEMQRFAQDVLLRGFINGDRYPTARLQEEVSAPGEWTPADGVQRYAMDYIGLNLASGVYDVTLTSDDPGVKEIVVGVRGRTADVYPIGRAVTVDFGQYDHTYLIAVNLTRPPNEAGCATARYTYAIKDATGSPTGPASQVDAPYFTAPRVEAVTSPADVPLRNPFTQTEYNINQEIKQVALPFSPIVPLGEPSGYTLDSVYGVDADQQSADFRAMNAPSGGVVAQMLYYNAQGQLIRITESPSIYVTIGEWLAVNHLEYKPGVQIWTTGGIDTAVVDKSGNGSGPYLVAFVTQEKFLAIDGDAPLDALLDMAARFAASF